MCVCARARACMRARVCMCLSNYECNEVTRQTGKGEIRTHYNNAKGNNKIEAKATVQPEHN